MPGPKSDLFTERLSHPPSDVLDPEGSQELFNRVKAGESISEEDQAMLKRLSESYKDLSPAGRQLVDLTHKRKQLEKARSGIKTTASKEKVAQLEKTMQEGFQDKFNKGKARKRTDQVNTETKQRPRSFANRIVQLRDDRTFGSAKSYDDRLAAYGRAPQPSSISQGGTIPIEGSLSEPDYKPAQVIHLYKGTYRER